MQEVKRCKTKLKWSPNFAYAIGLIATDGNLNKDGRHISLTSKDLELIEKFKTSINSKAGIFKTCRNNEKEKRYYTVSISDKPFFNFLNKIGLTPAKSKTIQKVKVPKKYFIDFIRGVFDGDGSFYTFWDKRWPKSFGYQISFASASKNFIAWLQKQLAIFYNVRGFIRLGDGVFVLRYVKRDSEKLFEAMYRRKENKLFLQRKYIKIKSALEFNKLLKIKQ